MAISRKIKVIDLIKHSPRLAWIDLQQQEEGEQPKHTAENLMANDLQVSRKIKVMNVLATIPPEQVAASWTPFQTNFLTPRIS